MMVSLAVRVPFMLFLMQGLVLAVLAGSSCIPPTVGRAGTLQFVVRAERGLAGDSDTVAVGGRVDITSMSRASSDGRRRREPLRVVSASSSNEKVLSVIGWDGGVVTVEGRTPGTAVVSFDTDAGADSIQMTVDQVDHFELTHLTSDATFGKSRPAVFLLGGSARFRVTALSKLGKHLGGRGITPILTVKPAGAAVVRFGQQDATFFGLEFKQTGPLKVAAANVQPITLTVVDPSEVSSVDWVTETGAAFPEGGLMRVDSQQAVLLKVTSNDGRLVWGTNGPAYVISLTPHRCEIHPARRLVGDGVYLVTAVAAGECRLQAKLGRAARELAFVVLASAASAP